MDIEKYNKISHALAALVFCIAVISSVALISGDQLGRVNLLYLLLLFVVWPVVSLISVIFYPLMRGKPSITAALILLPIWPRAWFDLLHDLKRNNLFKAWVFLQSQKLALVFSLGSLLSLMFVLLFNDVSFVWRSTLLSASQIFPVLEALAAPWLVIESAQPLLLMVELSQDSRLSLSPLVSGAGVWWRYIIMAQLCYAFLPRIFLYLFAKRKLNQLVLQKAKEQHHTQTLKPNNNVIPENLREVNTNELVLQNYVLLSWSELPEALLNKLKQKIGKPDCCYTLGAQGSDLLEMEALNDKRHKLLIVAAWEPPLGELEDFMRQSKGTILPLDWHDDKFVTVSELHLDEWRRFCFGLPDWTLHQTHL